MPESPGPVRLGAWLLTVGMSLAGIQSCARPAFDTTEYREQRAEERPATPPAAQPESFGKCAHFDKTRRPFFGDLHVHTTYSLDANLRGTRLTPRDAYRFAKGHAVRVGVRDDTPSSGRKVQLGRPLDFAAVTDHSEFLGVVELCQDPYANAAKRAGCVSFRETPDKAYFLLDRHLSERGEHKPALREPRLCGLYGRHCRAAQKNVWAEIQLAAEDAYDREGCKFTTFVAYEWTGSPRDVLYKKVKNHHRNVIFRTNQVPEYPIDYFHSPSARELWNQLDEKCVLAPINCDVLTIPHNSNLSAGTMFPAPKSKEVAVARAAMEPLIEIYQHKGASECLPEWPTPDELCGFEVVPFDNLKAAQFNEFDEVTAKGFVRYAYEEGFRSYERFGVNAFKYGIIGSTDNHLALAGNVRTDKFVGGGGAGKAVSAADEFYDKIYFGPGGLAVVWAEENSREALYRGLARKETYGTSGPRMRLRVFGGWDLPKNWCRRKDANAIGYARGVPMGGTLGASPARRSRPQFAIRAVKDPGTPDYPGHNLQRLQIIKGRLDKTGKYHVQIHDVAGDDKAGSDVSVKSCEPSEQGFSSLCTVWTDRDFDPSENAYYYVRVVQTPSCRWTALQCIAANYDCESPSRPIDQQCCEPRVGLHAPERCADVDCGDKKDATKEARRECCQGPPVSPLVLERAWSSPIWYQPE